MPQSAYMHALMFVSHRSCVHDVQPARNLLPRVGQANGCSRLDHTEFWPMYGRAERPLRNGRRNHRSSAAPMKSGIAKCRGPSRTDAASYPSLHFSFCSWVRLQVADFTDHTPASSTGSPAPFKHTYLTRVSHRSTSVAPGGERAIALRCCEPP